jgi:hypothetical protein
MNTSVDKTAHVGNVYFTNNISVDKTAHVGKVYVTNNTSVDRTTQVGNVYVTNEHIWPSFQNTKFHEINLSPVGTKVSS